jgi:large subunit ribosomal protein L9
MQTEVILKAKVEGLGAEADVVRVRPGYARNYLIPRGLAMPATAAFKHQVEKLKQARAEREGRELNEANAMATRLNRMTLTFQMTAGGDQDKVFGAVTANDLMERLAKENVAIDRKKLRMAQPLKGTGEHQVEIHLHPEVNASLKVVIEIKRPEGEEPEVDAKARKTGKKVRKAEVAPHEEKKDKDHAAKSAKPAKGAKSKAGG